jgi:hypothetical protein
VLAALAVLAAYAVLAVPARSMAAALAATIPRRRILPECLMFESFL